MDPGCEFCVVLSLRANVLNVSGVIGVAAELIRRAAASRPKDLHVSTATLRSRQIHSIRKHVKGFCFLLKRLATLK